MLKAKALLLSRHKESQESMLVLCISITSTSMKALVLAEGITLGLFENAFLKSVAFLLQLGLTFI